MKMLPVARAPHAASLRRPAGVANRKLLRFFVPIRLRCSVSFRAGQAMPVRSGRRGDTDSCRGKLGLKNLTIARLRTTNCEIPNLCSA